MGGGSPVSDAWRERPLDLVRFVAPAAMPRREPVIRIPLRLSDRPSVLPGQRVELGQPVIERFRDQELLEVSTTAAIVALRPGDRIDGPIPQLRGRRSGRGEDRPVHGRLIEHGRDGISRLAVGEGDLPVISPVAGRVVALTPGRLDILAEGLAIDGCLGWGRPAAGRLMLAAGGPDAEVRASSIDVAAAGAILVVGARVDIETLSRARAIGVSALVSGGAAGHDVEQLEGSDARQRAALHATAPFGLLALAGHGRMALPRHLWDVLAAADGRPAGVLPGSRLLLVGGDPTPLMAAAARPPGSVRIAGGHHVGEEGLLVGLTGARRWPDGTYAPGGFVELTDAAGRTERVTVPLGALERLA